jgi:hypothetical protein
VYDNVLYGDSEFQHGFSWNPVFVGATHLADGASRDLA